MGLVGLRGLSEHFYQCVFLTLAYQVSQANAMYSGQGVDESWPLLGVEAPHDLALMAAPARMAGTERPLAVLIGETRPSGSKLQKFILVPAGDFLLLTLEFSSFYCILVQCVCEWQAPHRPASANVSALLCMCYMPQTSLALAVEDVDPSFILLSL